jgi:NADPH-dependent 2,4-dienoyl-CoA reductase/sulfur reductase-like enzyme
LFVYVLGVPSFKYHRVLTCSEPDEKDLVIIGGGVAGYVAAIKAGQEGMKVSVRK